MIRSHLHLALHFVIPAVIAATFFREKFLAAWITMTATMLVDLDHLLADPVYDPGRCSIGFHPLHQYPLIAAYVVLAMLPTFRLIGVGLITHMFLDGIDCAWMRYD